MDESDNSYWGNIVREIENASNTEITDEIYVPSHGITPEVSQLLWYTF